MGILIPGEERSLNEHEEEAFLELVMRMNYYANEDKELVVWNVCLLLHSINLRGSAVK